MKIKDYLIEKTYLIIASIITLLIFVLFLNAVRCNGQVIIVIVALFVALILSILIVEYMRRNIYYRGIQETINSLDQKYLVSELIEEAHFVDGKILYDILSDVNRDMIEHVNIYKRREQEYRDYIEMWVHEIKTPLAASKLILCNHQSETSQSIEEELDKVEGFVEQALFYARSTTMEKDYLIKEMDLKTSINKVIRKYSKIFIYKKIKITLTDVDESVYSDAKWLEFILEQIISNALKYTPEETGEIKICTKKYPEMTQLYIEDNGMGIDLKDIKRVFDKGFTGSNGRKNEKATGMGLYLSKLLCDKLNLDIQISSSTQKGTTLCIGFPNSSMMLLK